MRAGDFTGVQNYRTIRIPGTGPDFAPLPAMPFTEPGDRFAEMQRPEALRHAVEYVHARTAKPVLVTENGLESENDERRIWFVDAALAGLHEAVEAGVPVLGYLHWSLIDNFRVDPRVRPPLRAGVGRPGHLRPDTEAQRGPPGRDRQAQRPAAGDARHGSADGSPDFARPRGPGSRGALNAPSSRLSFGGIPGWERTWTDGPACSPGPCRSTGEGYERP